jgi:hypothetical protein
MRNILLFIDNVAEAESLAKKALKIASQCKANLLLCNLVTNQVEEKLVISHHYDDDMFMYENDGVDIEELARKLKTNEQPDGAFIPVIDCLELGNFNPQKVKEVIVSHNIWLMVMDEQQLNRLKDIESGNYNLKILNNINCPLLLMPVHFEPDYLNKIAYITDLRYCDFGVIRFLKVFNAQLFITHISAPGLPDMDERYAQEILAEEISTKVNYWKMFLRNIKGRDIKVSIDKILDTVEIKMLSLVNKKHQTFERLFDSFPEKPQIYHNLPTLIFPYSNWFNQASFYI